MNNSAIFVAKGRTPINTDPRINNRIRAKEVRVVDDSGTQLGIMPIREAQRKAIELGLDLVEVAAQATPPVCRIMDFGKWKYEQGRKQREAKKNQTSSTVKEIQLRPGIAEHDLETKIRNARRFLHEGDKVRVVIRYKGREVAHQDIGVNLMTRVLESLGTDAIVDKPATSEGRMMQSVVRPAKNLGGLSL